MTSRPVWSIGISILIVIIAFYGSRFARLFGASFNKAGNTTLQMSTAATVSTAFQENSSLKSSLFDPSVPKTPVYFFSHGGPTFMYPDAEFGGDKGAYKTVKKLGKFIQTSIKPKFIIVISAHWQSYHDDKVEIGVPGQISKNVFGAKKSYSKTDPDELDLIYDFGGFPSYMYEEQFHSKGSFELAEDIKTTLKSENISSSVVSRGIDHGVWVPFKVAFSSNNPKGKEWDLDCPLVQVSLSASDDFKFHHKLGAALAKYRELGGVVICSGMSVHNLRDLMGGSGSRGYEYTPRFNDKVKTILQSTEGERLSKFDDLLLNHKKLLYSAHPTLEHFMPIVVASGAANDQVGEELYNKAAGSLGWGVYQFGEFSKEKL